MSNKNVEHDFKKASVPFSLNFSLIFSVFLSVCVWLYLLSGWVFEWRKVNYLLRSDLHCVGYMSMQKADKV